MVGGRKILFCFATLALLFVVGCQKNIVFDNQGAALQSNEGSNWVLNFSLANVIPTAELSPQPPTRSTPQEEYEHNINRNDIESLALFLIKENETDHNSYIVAYRIFLFNRDGEKYLYYNTSSDTSSDPHIPLSAAGGVHSDEGASIDDHQEATSDYGFNGFVGGVDGSRTEVRISFMYDHPLHGNLERLRVGKHTIAAIANFDETKGLILGKKTSWHIKEMISYWQRHQNDPDFKGIPSGRVADAGADGGVFEGYGVLLGARVLLSDATVDNYVNADHTPDRGDDISSESFIRPANQKPVATYIGNHNNNNNNNNNNNRLNLQLDRLLTRTTVIINNQTNFPVKVPTLSFDPNYAQAANFLFRNIDDNNIEYFHPQHWQGSPVLSSNRAIVPYVADATHAAETEHILFDGLLYGGGLTTTSRWMNVGVEFPGRTRQQYSVSNQSPIQYSTISSEVASAAWAVGETRSFLIQGNGDVFMKTNGNSPPTGDSEVKTIAAATSKLTGAVPDVSYVWRFKKIDANGTIIVGNEASGEWIKLVGTTSDNGFPFEFTSSEEEASPFTLNNYMSTQKVAFVNNTFTDKDVYLHRLGNNSFVAITKWNDGNTHFNVYGVDFGEVPMSQTITIPMTAYDKKTTTYAPLYTMRRNQHVIVSLRVRYNEQSQTIQVTRHSGISHDGKEWEELINDVTFD